MGVILLEGSNGYAATLPSAGVDLRGNINS